MNRVTPRKIKNKMSKALSLTKEAFEMSIPLLKTNQKENVGLLWEAFTREFIMYIKHRSKETGINLIEHLSIRNILFK